MIRRRNNKRTLYESIINDVAKTVKHHLNELSPDVYRRAADKREQLFNALPSYLKRQISKKNLNAPKDLRAHANKIEADINAKRMQAQKEYDELKNNACNNFKKQYLKLFKSRHKELIKSICYSLIKSCSYYYHDGYYNLTEFPFYKLNDKNEYINQIILYIDKEDIYLSSDKLDTDITIIKDFIDFRDNFVENLPCNQDLDEDEYEINGEIDDYYFTELFDLNILSDKDILQTIVTGDRLSDSSIFVYKGIYYISDNNFHVYPLKKIFKYLLSGDLRGEWDETQRTAAYYADSYDIFKLDLNNFNKKDIYCLSLSDYDGILFSNDKRTLNKIENDLWDEHILACGGVDIVE